jgi:hypothetical protein
MAMYGEESMMEGFFLDDGAGDGEKTAVCGFFCGSLMDAMRCS